MLALQAARKIGAANIGGELRVALITLLERENVVVADAARRGVPLDTYESPEFIAHLSRFVAELRDPRAIPALAEAIYGGGTVARALAAFGEQSVPAVTRVVAAPDVHYDVVNHALLTLRFVLEGQTPVSSSTRNQIRESAALRLTGKQYFTTLWKAMDLAITLNDPSLRAIVQTIASDRGQILARGISDPEVIARTQRLAVERLAGVPALPRR
ncbi:MAG: hypothetical protein ACRENP_22225 [Longimicrobiales bacterium]